MKIKLTKEEKELGARERGKLIERLTGVIIREERQVGAAIAQARGELFHGLAYGVSALEPYLEAYDRNPKRDLKGQDFAVLRSVEWIVGGAAMLTAARLGEIREQGSNELWRIHEGSKTPVAQPESVHLGRYAWVVDSVAAGLTCASQALAGLTSKTLAAGVRRGDYLMYLFGTQGHGHRDWERFGVNLDEYDLEYNALYTSGGVCTLRKWETEMGAWPSVQRLLNMCAGNLFTDIDRGIEVQVYKLTADEYKRWRGVDTHRGMKFGLRDTLRRASVETGYAYDVLSPTGEQLDYVTSAAIQILPPAKSRAGGRAQKAAMGARQPRPWSRGQVGSRFAPHVTEEQREHLAGMMHQPERLVTKEEYGPLAAQVLGTGLVRPRKKALTFAPEEKAFATITPAPPGWDRAGGSKEVINMGASAREAVKARIEEQKRRLAEQRARKQPTTEESALAAWQKRMEKTADPSTEPRHAARRLSEEELPAEPERGVSLAPAAYRYKRPPSGGKATPNAAKEQALLQWLWDVMP